MATTHQLDHSTDAFVASNGPTEGTDRLELENGKLLDIIAVLELARSS